MEYTFSWMWFFIGAIAVIAGALLVIYHKIIADNFGNGVSSYERYQLSGLITTAIGVVIMLNLHTLFLQWFFGMLFGR